MYGTSVHKHLHIIYIYILHVYIHVCIAGFLVPFYREKYAAHVHTIKLATNGAIGKLRVKPARLEARADMFFGCKKEES